MSNDERSHTGPSPHRLKVLDLPGQAHVAEGPHDQSGMYLMHHGFRRDLARFVRAARGTPFGADATWAALTRRWERFATVLHHHHAIEDTAMWPALLEHARSDDDSGAETMLLEMEAEHEHIDPALDGCRTALEVMRDHPCEEHRDALVVQMSMTRELLEAHLAHEETDALPYLQRTLSSAEYAEIEAAASRAYPTSMLLFLVPWGLDGLPEGLGAEILTAQGRIPGLLHRLTRSGFARREGRAFRYA